MKRIKLKKNKKFSFFKILLILVFLFAISLILTFKYIGSKLSDKVESYATKEAKKIITLVINKSVDKDIISNLDANEIFIESENTIDFDSKVINEILVTVNKKLKTNLIKLEKGNLKINSSNNDKKLKKGIIYEIPTGIIFNNALLSNIGPKIPVKLQLVGDILTSIDTNVVDYGINNAIIEVDIKITINEQVLLPYSSKQISVTEKIPLALKLIQGKIPNYYSNGQAGSVVLSDDI